MPRNGSVDNLRVLLVTLVIAHHVGQAYGPTGGSWPLFNAEQAPWLGAFFTVNAGFFMGLFFWIAGYFTPAAFDRKGASGFLRDRLMRIGIPLVVYWLLVSVPISYVYGTAPGEGISFAAYYFSPWRWHWPTVYMHLWFLGHLLVYAFVYAAWRVWRGTGAAGVRPAHDAAPPAGHGTLIVLVLALATASALVRLEFPQDRWVFVGVPVEVAHLPQYILMFALGIAAARTGWLERVPSRVGRVWLGIGIAGMAIMYLRLFRDTYPFLDLYRAGGYDWRTASFALWEAFNCFGLSVGLLVAFRDWVPRVTAWSRELAASSYTAYIVHIVIVVGVQQQFVEMPIGPSAKFFAVTAISFPIVFLAAGVLRRLPGARAVL